jgi:esterase/lipase superfamily enzyme
MLLTQTKENPMPKVYIASNRDFDPTKSTTDLNKRIDYPSIDPEGALTFLESPYDETKNPPMSFDDWLSDLKGETPNDRAMIFIHGYDNPWWKVKSDLVEMVSKFWTCPTKPYPGPIILFDWPSAGSYPDAQKLAVQTANLSFLNRNLLEKNLPDLQRIISQIAKPTITHPNGTKIDLVCHSMGNYVLQNGAQHLAPDSVSQCLMVAAAITNDLFSPSPSYPGGSDIVSLATRVTAYFSRNDDALPAGQLIDPWTEMGLWGPVSSSKPPTPTPPAYKNFCWVDCSTVVNQESKCNDKVHTSYYCIQQVLDDFIATLTDTTTVDRNLNGSVMS